MIWSIFLPQIAPYYRVRFQLFMSIITVFLRNVWYFYAFFPSKTKDNNAWFERGGGMYWCIVYPPPPIPLTKKIVFSFKSRIIIPRFPRRKKISSISYKQTLLSALTVKKILDNKTRFEKKKSIKSSHMIEYIFDFSGW